MVALGDVIAHHVRPPSASSSCSSAVASSAGSGDEVKVELFSLSCLFLRLHVLISMGERGRLSVQHHHHQRTAHLISQPCFSAASARLKNACIVFHVLRRTRAADQSVCLDPLSRPLSPWQHTLLLSRKSLLRSPCDGQVQAKKSHLFLDTLGIGM